MIETAPALPAVGPEPTTPIRPSEALRLGRLERPLPYKGAMFGRPGEACALGAIATGNGGEWMPVLLRRVQCPVETCHGAAEVRPLDLAIMELNDQHEWTDRQIVTWLESLGL